MYKSYYGHVFSFLCSRSGVSGSHDKCVLNFTSSCQTVCQRGRSDVHSSNSVGELQMSGLGRGWASEAPQAEFKEVCTLRVPHGQPARPPESVPPSVFTLEASLAPLILGLPVTPTLAITGSCQLFKFFLAVVIGMYVVVSYYGFNFHFPKD